MHRKKTKPFTCGNVNNINVHINGITHFRLRYQRSYAPFLVSRLDMRAVLEGFRRTYTEVYGPIEEGGRFRERDGRELFLMYLKTIINGTGNYYVEAQTRDQTRTDVVVDFLGERFGLEVGYTLSFNFNRRKEPGLRRVAVGDKILWEETV